ncbi:adenosylmethionine-8-amino-7-oxononanoate aminotransferase [Bradyrhizobium sp. USDA 4532]|nr:adenosylmethionine-8-amino-7-oxononanoate aminotransferase [Bradyrhizobium sp. USDA 4545]MCP1920365.1 adenosylmethionine-8-amino-7-oxononanoate aminotransferase [Bradyrhizobium sp. USDA 4532]
MTKVARGQGAYLHIADGRRIVDAISSWRVDPRPLPPAYREGHSGAGSKLNQIIFAGHIHDPAERLLRYSICAF